MNSTQPVALRTHRGHIRAIHAGLLCRQHSIVHFIQHAEEIVRLARQILKEEGRGEPSGSRTSTIVIRAGVVERRKTLQYGRSCYEQRRP